MDYEFYENIATGVIRNNRARTAGLNREFCNTREIGNTRVKHSTKISIAVV